MKIPSLALVLFSTLLLASCSDNFQARHDSNKFVGVTLGDELIKHYDKDSTLNIDGSPYFFTKDKFMLGVTQSKEVDILKSKISYIKVNCIDSIFGKSKIDDANSKKIQISGIECGSLGDFDLAHLQNKDWQRLCIKDKGDKQSSILAVRNNAKITIILSLGSIENLNPPSIKVESLSISQIQPPVGDYYQECSGVQLSNFIGENKRNLDAYNKKIAEIEENKKNKEPFVSFCTSLDNIVQITSYLGLNRINNICECGFKKSSNTLTAAEMSSALSLGVGRVDPVLAKFTVEAQMAIASCLDQENVPSDAKGLTKDVADLMRMKVKQQIAIRELIK
jgi:hypothetical protein